MQHPDSQKQGANSRAEKQITQQPSDQPTDDQKRNCLKTNITRNLLSDGQIYTPHTAALLWRCALILLHFKAAVQGFGTVKTKRRLCGTICQAAEAKDSWPNECALH